MKSEYNIALIGDLKGCVEIMLEVLVARSFPVGKIFPLQTESIDEVDDETKSVMFSGKPVDVKDINSFDWEQVDIAFSDRYRNHKTVGRYCQ
ncbi:hypothetical protein ACLKMH_13560 [Psychromonas sp. KJ10-10]|uniref:hypothetical protein n=1 Tax=Psychromonas sp. KJ10-10 TaxID=3391823 RepID=UPI0039B3FD63